MSKTDGEYELVLGNRQLLSAFFIIVILFGVFFTMGYNTDVAARSIWLYDIFVVPAARGRGVGYALMKAVAAETVRGGGVSLDWGVHPSNSGALEFYRRLGAVTAEPRIMGVSGNRLNALASAPTPE